MGMLYRIVRTKFFEAKSNMLVELFPDVCNYTFVANQLQRLTWFVHTDWWWWRWYSSFVNLTLRVVMTHTYSVLHKLCITPLKLILRYRLAYKYYIQIAWKASVDWCMWRSKIPCYIGTIYFARYFAASCHYYAHDGADLYNFDY